MPVHDTARGGVAPATPLRRTPQPDETFISFEHERMTTTAVAVAEAARTIEAAGGRLPNLVLSSHLEAKLAAWTVMLRDAGFGVCVSPSNPATTVPSAFEQLDEAGIAVLPRDPALPPPDDFWRELRSFEPDLVFDDGALLIAACNERDDLASLIGAVEFTTSGHESLSTDEGRARFPVIDVGLSFCKYELGNVYGTGVSALVAIEVAANVHLSGKRVLVIGYGAVGRSVAQSARSLGATALVTDSKLKNLARAHFDGHVVGAVEDLVGTADLVITCSGSASVLTSELLTSLPDNAIVANVGCFANEIDLVGLRRGARESVVRARQIETFRLHDGRRVHVLANAELVNLAIGRGWPIELIDLTFALSTLCFAELSTKSLPPGLHSATPALEEATLALFLAGR
jgi:adenosylhomocysteinase